MRFVDDWKDWPKWVSTWCEAAAVAFFSALLIAPDIVIQVWSVMPADIRAAIPSDWLKWGGVVLIVAGSVAKIVDQPKLKGK
ncbi:hypothetical protein RE432_18260 [Pusillimonas sp. SM2304]|uniref:DUF7940 domain-containing protein n=1 Tax=Pusillimonas sp. SM2304 TaxID=3073241 RepID=UPI002873F589|nr:hypothetical protein [Pusillimonas sp. SM2304]MDS1142381.1 hypothetical protein [Pusillimonas sp. SM2304]